MLSSNRDPQTVTPMWTCLTVTTRRRVGSLTKLLQALAGEYGEHENIGLVVLDNDPLGSAKSVVDAIRPAFRGSVIYEVESRQGYASARNAAVVASHDAQFVAFIDDDEIPEPGWLTELHRARERYGADVVAGAVVTDFPPETPEWLRTSPVMSSEQPRLATGSEMRWCATSSVLVSRRVFDSIAGGFDSRFDLTGGEDTHFFCRAHAAGFRIVWTNEARVRELIPIKRTHARWILRRAARTGNNKALIELEILRDPRTIIVRIAKVAGLFAIGALTIAKGTFRRDRGIALRGLQRSAEGAGAAVAFVGVRLS
jgi:succinoglycan biosynthesis protein ExoM